MKTFALIGVAGFVAPRHLRAIRDTGNTLVAAMDRRDSVGVLDQYFPEADFFLELERFDRFLEKQKQAGRPVHYLSVCTPNYLHDAHVRLGLRNGTSVICEKPLVLNPWNVEALARAEAETGKRIFNILQLRLHPDIIRLKEKASGLDPSTKAEVELTYITPRGRWYHQSWKGDEAKSGGIATNIGIHFFDMLIWIFGSVQHTEVHRLGPDWAAGFIELERANVRWFLSIEANHLPNREAGGRSFRSIYLNGEIVEFSEGFEHLHSKSYAAILEGKGFPLADVLPSVELVHRIRSTAPGAVKGPAHPMSLALQRP